jgi:hypothetical protein
MQDGGVVETGAAVGGFCEPPPQHLKAEQMDNQTLVVEQTLYFYDQPLLFTARLNGGELWAFTLSDQKDANGTYMGAPTTEATVAAVEANALPVSALFVAHAPIHTVEVRYTDVYEEDVLGTVVAMDVCADQEKAAKGCVPDPKVFLHL